MSEIINEYTLLYPFQNQNAGFSRWTYARKRGIDYFLKEFMNPIYPVNDSISEKIRKQRILECEEYERQKITLYNAINMASDGNIVRIIEFFRYKSHYYISTPLVNGVNLSFQQISQLPFEHRLLLCKTLLHSIEKLHQAHIVHSDIKDTNIMIKKTLTGKLVAKIIDFDCSFFEDNPPETEDDLGGDQVYLSPEACLFLCGEQVKLTSKIDVFALGLLCHQILVGKLPYFDKSKYDYAHESVLDGQELVVSYYIPAELVEIMQKMLCCNPDKRCCLKEVLSHFEKFFQIPDEENITISLNGKKTSIVSYADGANINMGSKRIHTSTNWFHQEEL